MTSVDKIVNSQIFNSRGLQQNSSLRATFEENNIITAIPCVKHQDACVPSEDSEPIVQLVELHSNQDLILRTTVDKRGKTVIFKATEAYNGLNGDIIVEFPPYCVLGEEKIFLEVLPEDIINSYNEKSSENTQLEKLITPVLHLDRQNGAPFLRNVTVTLPILSAAKNWIVGDFQCPKHIKYSENDSAVTLETCKFSPCGVQITVQKVMKALGLDDVFCLTYTESGIYLLMEQFRRGTTTEFKFDLRKFRSLQEHQKYRMDETKSLCMLLNPEKVLKSDHNRKIYVTVEGPLEVRNIDQDPRVSQNQLIFRFPNPGLAIDDCNERTVQLEKLDPKVEKFDLKIQYESQNMSDLGRVKQYSRITFLNAADIDKLTDECVKCPDILIGFLSFVKEQWITFLEEYLRLEISNLREFIVGDIKATIPISSHNQLTDSIRADVAAECRNRNYGEIEEAFETIPALIDAIFRKFVIKKEIRRAKREILSILKATGAISDQEDYPEGLILSNCEVLSSALMCLPVRQLKSSIVSLLEKISHANGVITVPLLTWNFLLSDSEEMCY